MKTVNIQFPFTLTHTDGKQQQFTPGSIELDDDIADHWYVQAHSKNPPKFSPKVGTPEYAKEAARKIQRRRIVEANAEIAEEEGDS